MLYNRDEFETFRHNIHQNIIEAEQKNSDADTMINTFWDVFQTWTSIYADRYHSGLFAYKSEIDEYNIEFGWSLNGCVLCIYLINKENLRIDMRKFLKAIIINELAYDACPKSASDIQRLFEQISKNTIFQNRFFKFLELALERCRADTIS